MIKKVTFTGIDQRTDINRLLEIQKKYPLAEFGFLASESATGKRIKNRYPDLIMLQKLKNKDINLALHACGRLARQTIHDGNLDYVEEFMGPYFGMFQRLQLNIVGNKASKTIEDTKGKQIIIQTNLDEPKSKENFELFKGTDVVFLSDKSGGRGTAGEFDYFDMYQGFAGGLNADNILEKKEEIDILSDYDYWLDMESGVRTDDWFDLDKVEAICKLLFG